MGSRDLALHIASLAALADPVRRALYLAVAGSAEPVGRDAAASAAGVSRALAAFHLDKLVDAGLLEASFKRLTGRSGPGAGRPSKLYSRSAVQVDVSLPERRYEWAAQMLVRALAAVRSEESEAALRRSARSHGESIGREQAEECERELAEEREDMPESGVLPERAHPSPLHDASRALSNCGFEPVTGPDGEVLLRNCPFDRLREGCRELVCGMNLSLIEGVLAGLSLEGVQAVLEPRPGHCCVVLREAGNR